MSETTGQVSEQKKGPGRPPNAPKNRPKRIPLGERGRLVYSPQLLAELKAQDLVPRLITDKPGRIDAALQAGYRFVQSDGQIGEERVADPSNMGGNLTTHVGDGQVGYLMVLPKEFYDEDQKVKQQRVDDSEAAMKAPPAKLLDREGKKGDGTVYGPGLTDE